MPVTSAGLLLYRLGPTGLEVLLVHPGGPIWIKRDEGAWSIPKGEHGPDDDPLETAIREFTEELGSPPPRGDGPALDLGEVRQRGGKQVRCFARRGDADVSSIASNEFEMEWPPRSGNLRRFPEVDRAEWFDLAEASRRINAAQAEFLTRLADAIATAADEPPQP